MSDTVSVDPADFAHVRAWVFDLDDTLYQRSTGMGRQISDGIRGFVSDYFDVDATQAAAIQQRLVTGHGTTLQGMRAEHGVEARDFLSFEDHLDYDVLAPDPVLAAAMTSLPGRRFVFTNGSRAHAERVLHRIGLTEHFEDIYDILAADLVPKPIPATYRQFVERTGIEPTRAAMFEDRAINLVEARALGMRTVLVGSPGAPARLEPGQEADVVTDDLAGLLGRIVQTV